MGAFIRCDNLKDVNVDSENKVYKNIDGVIYTDNRKTLILFPANHSLKSFAVPATVTKIGDCAFYCCENLETITFKEVHEWYATRETFYDYLFISTQDSGEKVKTATFSTIEYSLD